MASCHHAANLCSKRRMPPAKNSIALSLNPHTLQLGGPCGWVDITDAEFALLTDFAASANRRLESARMLERVGKIVDDRGKRALEVQIVRLRKKLAHAGAMSPTIKAIRGFGYQLCIPIEINQ